MTPAQIRRRRKTLARREEKVADDIRELRNACSHPSATRIPKANTGNYDPSADCYWLECRCPDCGKYWHEDQ